MNLLKISLFLLAWSLPAIAAAHQDDSSFFARGVQLSKPLAKNLVETFMQQAAAPPVMDKICPQTLTDSTAAAVQDTLQNLHEAYGLGENLAWHFVGEQLVLTEEFPQGFAIHTFAIEKPEESNLLGFITIDLNNACMVGLRVRRHLLEVVE